MKWSEAVCSGSSVQKSKEPCKGVIVFHVLFQSVIAKHFV